MKVIKTQKAFYETQPDNSEIDPIKLQKGQILSFKMNGNENKVGILGGASKASGKFL